MPSASVLALKDRYQNGKDNIGRDLIARCLSEASLYRRGTGFFSSSALKAYAAAMDHIIGNKVKLEILCSPVIQDKSVIRQFEELHTAESRAAKLQVISETIVLTAIGYKLDPERRDYRQRLLAYLISSGQLEFKFAVPKSSELDDFLTTENESNLYHVKNGYFRFGDGSVVAFDGSFNESESGHRHHIDRTQVYRSWIKEDSSRLLNLVKDVDTDWEEKNPHIEIFHLSREAMQVIRRVSPTSRPRPPTHGSNSQSGNCPQDSKGPSLWAHQTTAVEKFIVAGHGILEMATGTGKTRTALEIMRRLIVSGKIESIIVCTYGTDLLNQWSDNFDRWLDSSKSIPALSVFKMYDSHNELQAFINAPKNSILLLSRDADRLTRLLKSDRPNWARTIIVHDEIHGLASPAVVAKLRGLHARLGYRLGLSATPEREYDVEGNNFIEQEIGKVVYAYPLENAIRDGILCEFDYELIPFSLTEDDAERRKSVFGRYAASQYTGAPWTQERLFIELSKVVKSAVQKPAKLDAYLSAKPESLRGSIVFVLDRNQGGNICEVIRRHTISYRSYYAGTDSQYIEELSSGRIVSLVACERLNEGVDIKKLRSVFLVSSNRAKLDTIQRIGRCLRKDPEDLSKRALVVDFVTEETYQAFLSGTSNDQVAFCDVDEESANREMKADLARIVWLHSVSLARFEGVSREN